MLILVTEDLMYLLWNCHQMNVTGSYCWSVNIGSGDGLVPSGKKPKPEPMLTRSVSPYGVTRPQWVKVAEAARKSKFKLTKGTPYLALTGELRGGYFEYSQVPL